MTFDWSFRVRKYFHGRRSPSGGKANRSSGFLVAGSVKLDATSISIGACDNKLNITEGNDCKNAPEVH